MIWKVLKVKRRPFQFSPKFEKRLSCLNRKEISPALFFKTLLAQN